MLAAERSRLQLWWKKPFNINLYTAMAILIFFTAHWFSSLFFQTFFQHHYAYHRMFTMTKKWERIVYLLALLFEGSSFLNPRAYAIMHRAHHAHGDTEDDPHSPQF